MKSDMEMKMALLDQLEELLLGNEGKQFEPKGKGVTVMSVTPIEKDEDIRNEMPDDDKDRMLEDLASKELAEPEDDEDNEPRKKGLKEFLRSC